MAIVSRATLAAALALMTLVAATATAQDVPPAPAPAPCHDNLCAVTFDWGNGSTAASMPTDRRYGAPTDFEVSLKQALADQGLRITDTDRDTKLSIVLRMSMMSAICDFMPGTNTDRSCKTVRDVAVSFAQSDPAAKKIGATRITNRCGASDQAMSTAQFGRYTALMIDYLMEGEAKHAPRPSAKC